eukprot:799318-Rhodomonas_salina.2
MSRRMDRIETGLTHVSHKSQRDKKVGTFVWYTTVKAVAWFVHQRCGGPDEIRELNSGTFLE